MKERTIGKHVAHAIISVKRSIQQFVTNMGCKFTCGEFYFRRWSICDISLFDALEGNKTILAGGFLFSILVRKFLSTAAKSKVYSSAYFTGEGSSVCTNGSHT